jgi:hypothetical protein
MQAASPQRAMIELMDWNRKVFSFEKPIEAKISGE